MTTLAISGMKYIRGGWEAEGWQHRHPQGGKQQCYVFSRAQKLCATCTVNLVGRDSRQQQFDISSSLISAHQWPCGPSQFYRVGKRLPVKADLAIYSPVTGILVLKILVPGPIFSLKILVPRTNFFENFGPPRKFWS